MVSLSAASKGPWRGLGHHSKKNKKKYYFLPQDFVV